MNLQETKSPTVVTAVTECPSDCRNKLLKLALSIVQSPTQDRSKALEKLSHETGLSTARLGGTLAIYLAMVRLFLQSKDKEFNGKLLELGFPGDFVEGLPLVSHRDDIVETIESARGTGKPVLMQWRIDISLSTSVPNKKLPISVMMCFQLKDGRKVTFNADVKTFHKLRFNVALIMKEFATLKSSQKSIGRT